ncbi:hypothetical protein [Methylobacterium sp. 77]|uniref:hypothetical protein n=1 Tax=Methylobacterium sp. 77 TaxID=1101192 RepID=UPI0012DCADB6|nr:hypothetical protein [Methylobacterium sp. 77]
MNEAWEPSDINDDLAYRIKKSIYCELIQATRVFNSQERELFGKKLSRLPKDWGAQMTLTLTVDETSSINPSGSYNRNISSAFDPLAPNKSVTQSLVLPFTTQASTQAVRTDSFYSFYTIQELVRNRYIDTTCGEYDQKTNTLNPLDRSGSSYLLSGNLGIYAWMKGALLANNTIPTSKLPSSAKPLDVLQYTIKFVVVTSAGFNPMWKLAPVSTGIGGSPLVSGNRTRSHQLLLTLGPTSEAAGRNGPAPPSISLHNYGQLELAFTNALQQK